MPRGRLLFPFLAGFERIDPAAIAAVDPPGPQTEGYDPVFKEPRPELVAGHAKPIGRWLVEVRIPAQIDHEIFEAARMVEAGNVPRGDLNLTMHYRDLDRLGLVEADGNVALRPGDRLVAIYEVRTEVLVQTIKTPPGLFIDSVTPTGHGLSLRRPKRNLLIVSLRARDEAARART